MATISYNPKLRALVSFLVDDYVDLVIKSTGEQGLVGEILDISVVREWARNAEDNIFDDSYTELDSDDMSWMMFLLMAVVRQDNDDTLEHMIQDVTYRLEDNGKITIFSKEELDIRASDYFGELTSFEKLEDADLAEFLQELDAESFGFMDYVRELIVEAKSM